MTNKWIILIQLGYSAEPSWWHDDTPVLFDSKEEAMAEMYDDYINTLQNQLSEAKRGLREWGEMDSEISEWVEPCEVDEEGCIYLLGEGLLYDPKTWIR